MSKRNVTGQGTGKGYVFTSDSKESRILVERESHIKLKELAEVDDRTIKSVFKKLIDNEYARVFSDKK